MESNRFLLVLDRYRYCLHPLGGPKPGRRAGPKRKEIYGDNRTPGKAPLLRAELRCPRLDCADVQVGIKCG